jgi:hypothetical protein
MRLLGSNLLPFSVAQLPATWSTGLEVEAYFFEGDMPSDPSQYFFDQRKLIADCVAASRIVLQPTSDGLMFHQAYSHGIKAVAGSVYDPKLGVTVHYPNSIIPRRTTASSSTMDIDTAYAVDLMTGNKKLKQHLSLAMFPGFPINAVRTLTDFAGNTSGQIATVCDLIYDRLITFDAALSDGPDKSVVGALTIAANSSTSGASPSGTTAVLSVPVNVATNLAPSTIITDNLRVTGSANVRRTLPVSVGDKSTAPVTKTIGHAILVIPDSNNGALAVGNYDIRLMVTKVGVKGSGELIELDSVSVSTGDFAEVVQVRTATSVGTTVPDTSWISTNAIFAFNSLRFSSSPSTDYKGVPFTFSQITAQPDKSIKIQKGSSINIAAADITFDPTQSFWIELEYRQDDISSLAEVVFYGRYKSFDDRFVVALDRSNETGFVIWNNAQAVKISRPLSTYAALLSSSFVKLLYEYDADTFTHRVSVNGVVIDTFTYRVLAVSSYASYFSGGYGAAVVPACYWRNYQLVPGKKS